MTLTTKAKVNLVVASVSLVAVAIIVVQNLTPVDVDLFYFTIETSLAVITPTIFLLGFIVGWIANSLVRRKRAKRKTETTP